MPNNEVTQQVGLSKDTADVVAATQTTLSEGMRELNAGITRMLREQEDALKLAREQIDAISALSRNVVAWGDAGENQAEAINALNDNVDANLEAGFNELFANQEEQKLYQAAAGASLSDLVQAQIEHKQAVEVLQEKMDKANQIAEENLKVAKNEAAKPEGERAGTFDRVSGALGNVQSGIQGVGQISGSLNSVTGGIQSIMNGDIMGIANVVGGASSLIELVPKVFGGAGAPAAAAIGGLLALREGSKALQGLRDEANQYGSNDNLLGAKMSIQAMLTGYGTGLDVGEVRNIEENLLKGGVEFGSSEFNSAYDFAVGARQKYSIDGDTSTRMYINAVENGTLTMTELKETLQNLNNTAKESNKGMNELMEEYEENRKTMTDLTGSEVIGESITAKMTQYMDPATVQAFTESISSIDDKEKYNSMVMRYIEAGYGDASYAIAAEEYLATYGKGMEGLTRRAIQEMGSANPDAIASYLSENITTDSDMLDLRDWLQTAFETNPEYFSKTTGIEGGFKHSEYQNDDIIRLASMIASDRHTDFAGYVTGALSAEEIADIGSGGLTGTTVMGQTIDLVSAINNYGKEAPQSQTLSQMDPSLYVDTTDVNNMLKMSDDENADAVASLLDQYGIINPAMGQEERREFARSVLDRFRDDGGGDWQQFISENMADLAAETGAQYQTVRDNLGILIEFDDEAFKRKLVKWERDGELGAGTN